MSLSSFFLSKSVVTLVVTLATSIAGAAVFLTRQHDVAGHSRHDAQVTAMKQDIILGLQNLREEVHHDNQLYENQIESRVQRIEKSMGRVEDKLDYYLLSTGVGLPRGVPTRVEAVRKEAAAEGRPAK